MENKTKTTTVYLGNIGIMKKKMEIMVVIGDYIVGRSCGAAHDMSSGSVGGRMGVRLGTEHLLKGFMGMYEGAWEYVGICGG